MVEELRSIHAAFQVKICDDLIKRWSHYSRLFSRLFIYTVIYGDILARLTGHTVWSAWTNCLVCLDKLARQGGHVVLDPTVKAGLAYQICRYQFG